MELRVPMVKWKMEDPVLQAAFSPDQTKIGIASGAQRYFGVAAVYQMDHKGNTEPGAAPPLAFLEHPDCVASTSSEGQLQIWGIPGRMSRRLQEHQRFLNGSLEVTDDAAAAEAAAALLDNSPAATSPTKESTA